MKVLAVLLVLVCAVCTMGQNCPKPQCPPGCRPDFSMKPCAGCACSANADLSHLPGGYKCGPVKCPANCHADYSMKPCPGCKCSGAKG